MGRKMSWLTQVDVDLLPIVANFAPRGFKKFNPYKISKKLGSYDLTRWQKVLRAYRTDLTEDDSDCVSAEFLDCSNRIKIVIGKVVSVRDDVAFTTLQTLLHELIHVNQFNTDESQYYKPTCPVTGDEDRDYYALFGEVQAFAHCIFLESIDHGTLNTPTMERYRDAHPNTIKTLYKQIHRWKHKYQALLNTGSI
jgi:hypothetical protein